MKIRKSIKVLAVIAVGVMLALTVFLAWDFSGGPSRHSLRFDEIVDYTKHELFNFEGRRIAKCYRALDASRTKLENLEKTDSNDVDVLMGIHEVRSLYVALERNDRTLQNIRAAWPEYGPATAEAAWGGAYGNEWRDRGFTVFDLLTSRNRISDFDEQMASCASRNDMGLERHRLEDFMLKEGDPFLCDANMTDTTDPNLKVFVVTDAVAARKAVIERFGVQIDACLMCLREMKTYDPNNGLYDYMLAIGYARRGRSQEAARCLAAANGRKADMYPAERLACMKKVMEKARLPGYLQRFAIERQQMFFKAEQAWLVRMLRSEAMEAEKGGDTETARAMEEAAAKLAPVTPTHKPAGK